MLKYKNLTTAFNTEKSLEISERGWQAAGGAAARRGRACRRAGPRRGEGARVNTSGRSEARVRVQTGRAAVRRRCACRRVGPR